MNRYFVHIYIALIQSLGETRRKGYYRGSESDTQQWGLAA